MNNKISAETWLTGPVDGVPDLLQPVAHALLESREEIKILLADFDETLLWQKPAGLASVAFHLQHIAGVQDRLFSYAKGLMLNEEQLLYLQNEGMQKNSISLNTLLQRLNMQTEKSIEQLKQTGESILTEARSVGRKQLPSTVVGLLFHAAEHTMRHVGQLLATIKLLPQLQNTKLN